MRHVEGSGDGRLKPGAWKGRWEGELGFGTRTPRRAIHPECPAFLFCFKARRGQPLAESGRLHCRFKSGTIAFPFGPFSTLVRVL